LAIGYLCQIPKRKPTGNLILSVLVTDLVFLQVLWLFFTFYISQYMKRKDDSSDTCAGYAAHLGYVEQDNSGDQMCYERLVPDDVEIIGLGDGKVKTKRSSCSY
jgi:hypothetical protein